MADGHPLDIYVTTVPPDPPRRIGGAARVADAEGRLPEAIGYSLSNSTTPTGDFPRTKARLPIDARDTCILPSRVSWSVSSRYTQTMGANMKSKSGNGRLACVTLALLALAASVISGRAEQLLQQQTQPAGPNVEASNMKKPSLYLRIPRACPLPRHRPTELERDDRRTRVHQYAGREVGAGASVQLVLRHDQHERRKPGGCQERKGCRLHARLRRAR